MESLTPFIRHEMQNTPGTSGSLGETSSRISPPLGTEPEQKPPVNEPPSQPDNPDVQLPPPEVPQPHPGCGSQLPPPEVPQPNSQSSHIPMTDGTPVACRQKNAAEYLAGHSPGVMTQYGDGLYARNPGCGSQQSLCTLSGARASLAAAPTAPPCSGRRPRSSPLQHKDSREPAPDKDTSGVLQLVEWREEAPYG